MIEKIINIITPILIKTLKSLIAYFAGKTNERNKVKADTLERRVVTERGAREAEQGLDKDLVDDRAAGRDKLREAIDSGELR